VLSECDSHREKTGAFRGGTHTKKNGHFPWKSEKTLLNHRVTPKIFRGKSVMFHGVFVEVLKINHLKIPISTDFRFFPKKNVDQKLSSEKKAWKLGFCFLCLLSSLSLCF
jgi:hypothetical protein